MTSSDVKKAYEEKKVLKGLVKMCETIPNEGREEAKLLMVQCENQIIYIASEEIERHLLVRSKYIVGEVVHFVVIAITPEGVFGSMKEATKIRQKPIMEKLERGEELEGIVTALTPQGAYISINGVSGFMNNYDFANDGSEIRQFYKKMAPIKVVLKKITTNGKVRFKMVQKRGRKPMIDVSAVAKGQRYLGKVIKTSGFGVIVLIDAGIEVRCNYPENIDMIQENDQVIVVVRNVKSFDNGTYLIKGKILDRILL